MKPITVTKSYLVLSYDFRLKTDDVEIMILKPTSKEIKMTMTTMQKLGCINANLVALCIGNNTDQIDCLGFGTSRKFHSTTTSFYLKIVFITFFSSNLSQESFEDSISKQITST